MTCTFSVRAHHCLTLASISAIFVILCNSQVKEMPTILMIGSPAILGREQEISCSISAIIDTPETPFPLTWTRSDMPNKTVNSLRTRTVISSNQVTFISLIKFNATFNDHNVTFTCKIANGTSESLKLSVIQLPEDPTISGPEYVNDNESFTWTCRVDGASYAPPRIQWLNNRGVPITLGVNTTFTDYWNEYNIRIFNVTSNLTLSFHLETSKSIGMTCRSIHEASKTTKDSPFFKITTEKTQTDLKWGNSSSETQTDLKWGNSSSETQTDLKWGNSSSGMPTVSITGSPAIIGHEQEISCSISASTDTPETPFPLTWTRSDRPNETLNPFRTRTVRINNQVTFISLIKINVTFSDHDVTFTCTMANGTSRFFKISVIQPPEDPTISGQVYVNDTESHTWTCSVGGASYAPPHIQWFNNRGMPITKGVLSTFTEYRNKYGVRLFNVTSSLTLAFYLENSHIFGMTCRSIHEASKTTKDSPYFKITIEKTRKDFNGENSISQTQTDFNGDNSTSGMPTILMIGSPAILGREQEISCSISDSTDTPETPFPLTWKRSDRPNETLNPFRTRTVRSNNQVTFISLIKFNVTFNDHDVTFMCKTANGTSNSMKLLVIQPPEDPTISGPEYVNDNESFTWTCRVGGASYAPPRVQWLNSRGMPITLGVHTTFTDYKNEYNIRIFKVTSNLTMTFHWATSQIFGVTCRSVLEASKITKDSPYFKITIEKTQTDFKGKNSVSVTRTYNCCYVLNHCFLLITICLITCLQNYV